MSTFELTEHQKLYLESIRPHQVESAIAYLRKQLVERIAFYNKEAAEAERVLKALDGV